MTTTGTTNSSDETHQQQDIQIFGLQGQPVRCSRRGLKTKIDAFICALGRLLHFGWLF